MFKERYRGSKTSNYSDRALSKHSTTRRARVCYHALIRLDGVPLNNVKIAVNFPTTTTNRITTHVFSGTRRVMGQVTRGCTSLVKGVNLTTRPTKRLPRGQHMIIQLLERDMTFPTRRVPRLQLNRRDTRLTLAMSMRRVPTNLRATLRSTSTRTLFTRLFIPTTSTTNGINTITHLMTRGSHELWTNRRQNTLFSRSNLGITLRIFNLPTHFPLLSPTI